MSTSPQLLEIMSSPVASPCDSISFSQNSSISTSTIVDDIYGLFGKKIEQSNDLSEIEAQVENEMGRLDLMFDKDYKRNGEDAGSCALNFWGKECTREAFPLLSAAADKYLSCIASSCPAESAFSFLSFVMHKRRKSVKISLLGSLCMLWCEFKNNPTMHIGVKLVSKLAILNCHNIHLLRKLEYFAKYGKRGRTIYTHAQRSQVVAQSNSQEIKSVAENCVQSSIAFTEESPSQIPMESPRVEFAEESPSIEGLEECKIEEGSQSTDNENEDGIPKHILDSDDDFDEKPGRCDSSITAETRCSSFIEFNAMKFDGNSSTLSIESMDAPEHYINQFTEDLINIDMVRFRIINPIPCMLIPKSFFPLLGTKLMLSVPIHISSK